jgi:hypothetical protein
MAHAEGIVARADDPVSDDPPQDFDTFFPDVLPGSSQSCGARGS